MGNASATAASSALLTIEQAGAVLTVGLNRPAKRNALNDGIILALQDCFSNIPDHVRAVVVHGIGEHFSAGLDLSELTERDATAGLIHSQMWHRVFDRIQYSRVPVIAALRGAVIGGGLELACAAHIRVAEPSAYYALPEGQRADGDNTETDRADWITPSEALEDFAASRTFLLPPTWTQLDSLAERTVAEVLAVERQIVTVEPHLAERNGNWEIEFFDSDRYNNARNHRAPDGYGADTPLA